MYCHMNDLPGEHLCCVQSAGRRGLTHSPMEDVTLVKWESWRWRLYLTIFLRGGIFKAKEARAPIRGRKGECRRPATEQCSPRLLLRLPIELSQSIPLPSAPQFTSIPPEPQGPALVQSSSRHLAARLSFSRAPFPLFSPFLTTNPSHRARGNFTSNCQSAHPPLPQSS